MWFKTGYRLHSEEKRNRVRKQRGLDSKYHIRYHLLAKGKINGVCKDGGCDSK